MSALRSVAAVAAGFAATFALSVATDAALHAAGVFPPLGERASDGALAFAALYRTAYTVAGGALTARLAPRRAMRHAMVLAGLGTALSVLGAVATWNAGPAFGPHWYPVALAVLAAPSVWAGARLTAAS